MPNRIVREGLIDSRKVAAISDFGFRLYTSLLMVADDAGRYRASPELVKARAMPLSKASLQKIGEALGELEQNGLLYIYAVDGESHLQILNWQCCGRGKHSKYPFDDGGFQIELISRHTRDGEKLFVASSLTRKRSSVLQLSHTDGMPMGSDPMCPAADTYTNTETNTNTETKECAATAARFGVGPIPQNYTPEFETAFDAWRKTGRGGKNKHDAFKAWWKAVGKIRRRPGIEDAPGWLLERIKSYAASEQGVSPFSPMMATWLNNDCFDESDADWRDKRANGHPQRPDRRHEADRGLDGF